jgi:hypothetical protein
MKYLSNRFKGLTLPFIMQFLITLIIMFSLGVIVGIIAGVSPNPLTIMWWALRVILKFGCTWVTFIALASVIARGLLGTTLRDLFLQMHDKVALQENLSPFALTAGLLIALAQVFSPHAATLPLYFYEVLTKGALGILLGFVATVFVAWTNNVKSLREFDELFNKKDNNQLVLFLVVSFNVAVHFAMTS